MERRPRREPATLSGRGRSRPVVVAMAVAAFALLTTISAAQIYALRRAVQESISVPVAFAFGAAAWLGWGVAVPVVLLLARRFDFHRGRRVASLLAHAVGLLVVHTLATVILIVAGIRLFNPEEAFPWGELRPQLFAGSRFQIGIVLYLAILGLGRGLELWRALREREQQAQRLEAQATRARLEALAARLQPHFLFNTLHAVGALIDESPARARAVLAELGELLREVLDDPGTLELPLGEELGLLGRYLAIEEIRFADRLRVEVEVPADLQGVPVPRFLLQPLVENALRHGIGRSAAGGTLRITARREPGTVRIAVANDGPPVGDHLVEGVGMTTTRDRLHARHGEAASLTLRNHDGWVVAEVVLPTVSE